MWERSAKMHMLFSGNYHTRIAFLPFSLGSAFNHWIDLVDPMISYLSPLFSIWHCPGWLDQKDGHIVYSDLGMDWDRKEVTSGHCWDHCCILVVLSPFHIISALTFFKSNFFRFDKIYKKMHTIIFNITQTYYQNISNVRFNELILVF